MTDAELVEIADIVDWWIPSWTAAHGMLTLRQALAAATERAEQASVTLFRPGGGGTKAIWLRADRIARLHAALSGRRRTRRNLVASR